MKLREIFKEDANGDDGVYGGNGEAARSSASKLHHNHQTAIQGMKTYPELPGWYYNMYRFGVAMANSPENEFPYAQQSLTANQLATFAYTEADKEIIGKAEKTLGIKGKKISSDKSTETHGTNSVSPVAKPKRNKYGV